MIKNKKWNILFIVISGIGLIVYILLTGNWSRLISQLRYINMLWVSLGFAAIVAYWIFETIILHWITYSLHGKYNFRQAFKVTIIGQFFNMITPFASGGQPIQLYTMSQQKVGAGVAGSILMIKFIVYQSVLVIYSLILIIWKASFFQSNMSNFFYLIFVGFGINLGVIGFLFILTKDRLLKEKIFDFVLKLLSKIRLIKNVTKYEQKINKHLNKFHLNIEFLANNKSLLVKIIVLSFLQLTSYFLIPYFIYRSFGLLKVGIINMVAAHAFVQMIISFVPVPGASGGAEGGFYLFFKMFFSKGNILTAILIWRVYTYYAALLVGGIFLLFGKTRGEKVQLTGHNPSYKNLKNNTDF